ncbi:uncharacterized protein BJ212DRAFT_1420268 [Suillus subaureus]|uniref:Uncharacterized protein n=1 Tax=Suillus subaureus TaxID=48587 RepID=A0A9P7AL25_9AGAM|nr:uncharacterized protein BJ212DRAFT_1420268 [Suillus subaureus]KAG1790736.1 hypothetical protein BJ212DRAFT_1420268 [Suillus subaureus]
MSSGLRTDLSDVQSTTTFILMRIPSPVHLSTAWHRCQPCTVTQMYNSEHAHSDSESVHQHCCITIFVLGYILQYFTSIPISKTPPMASTLAAFVRRTLVRLVVLDRTSAQRVSHQIAQMTGNHGRLCRKQGGKRSMHCHVRTSVRRRPTPHSTVRIIGCSKHEKGRCQRHLVCTSNSGHDAQRKIAKAKNRNSQEIRGITDNI